MHCILYSYHEVWLLGVQYFDLTPPNQTARCTVFWIHTVSPGSSRFSIWRSKHEVRLLGVQYIFTAQRKVWLLGAEYIFIVHGKIWLLGVPYILTAHTAESHSWVHSTYLHVQLKAKADSWEYSIYWQLILRSLTSGRTVHIYSWKQSPTPGSKVHIYSSYRGVWLLGAQYIFTAQSKVWLLGVQYILTAQSKVRLLEVEYIFTAHTAVSDSWVNNTYFSSKQSLSPGSIVHIYSLYCGVWHLNVMYSVQYSCRRESPHGVQYFGFCSEIWARILKHFEM